MKIKVWQIAKDEDRHGTSGEVYGTEEAMNAALWEWFASMDDEGRDVDELRAHFDGDAHEAYNSVSPRLTTAQWGSEEIEISDPYPAMTAALQAALSFFEVCGDDEDTNAIADQIKAALAGERPATGCQAPADEDRKRYVAELRFIEDECTAGIGYETPGSLDPDALPNGLRTVAHIKFASIRDAARAEIARLAPTLAPAETAGARS